MRAPKNIPETTPAQEEIAGKIEKIEEEMRSNKDEIRNAFFEKRDDDKAVLVGKNRVLDIERKKLVYSL